MKVTRVLPLLLIIVVVAFFAFTYSSNNEMPLTSDELYLKGLSDSGYEYATFSAG